MSISMEQVAKLAGTSRATVSYVLRNRWHEKGISEPTRKRILSVAQQHGYRPNNLARGLVSGKTQIIGVQLPAFIYEHWSSIQKHLDDYARQRRYRLLFSSPTIWYEEEREIEMLLEQRVDGLILAPRRAKRMWRLYESLRRENKPFVFLGNSPGKGYFSVVDDNLSQARLAVDHLIRLGHRRIAHLVGPLSSRASIERYLGYRQALAEAGLPLCKDWMRHAGVDSVLGCKVGKELLRMDGRPTAIYAAVDAVALGAIMAAEQMGLRVPEDVAVVGHADDIPFIECHRTPLTTVRQPRQALAEGALAMLLDLIEGRRPERPVVRIGGELVIRQSCGGLGAGIVESVDR